MKPTFFMLSLLVSTTFVLVIPASLAQLRTPGVAVGNEFTYTERSFWLTSDPNLPQPIGLADINATEYYRVSVTGVSGVNVLTHIKWHFTNGTDVEKDGSVNTETADYQGGFWSIIGSNLNATDRVHPNSEQDLSTINETRSWDYGSYQRQVNHLILTFKGEKSDISGSDYTENVDTYFDRQTGALVKLGDNHAYSNPETVLAVTWQLISQNAWTGSDSGQELSWVVIVGVVTAVLIVLLIIGLVFRRRRKKPE